MEPPGGTGSYDSLNAYICGAIRGRMGLIFDSLMSGSLDERDALYGL